MKSKSDILTLRAKFLDQESYTEFCRQINRPDLIQAKTGMVGKTISYKEIRKTLVGEKSILEMTAEQLS